METATQADFDVVLMDLHMPQMDGLAATRAIRALPAPRGGVPILALTADAFAETRQRATEAGMNDFLAKPVQPTDLQRSLARLFGRPRVKPSVAVVARPAPVTFAAGLSTWLDLAVPDLIFESLPAGTHGQLLSVFFADHSGSLARLGLSLEGPPDATLRGAAHAVRGAALSLGLRRIAETTSAIETLADDSSAAALRAARDRFHVDLAQTRAACTDAGWVGPEPARRESA